MCIVLFLLWLTSMQLLYFADKFTCLQTLSFGKGFILAVAVSILPGTVGKRVHNHVLALCNIIKHSVSYEIIFLFRIDIFCLCYMYIVTGQICFQVN